MFLAYKTMNKQHIERLLLTGTIFLFAGFALLIMQPVLAASVSTKNKQAYQKMFTYLCSAKSNKTLKNTACPLLKTYQNKQTTYTDTAFLKTVCTKNKTTCQLINKNKAYKKITTPLLITPKKVTVPPARTPETNSVTPPSVQAETNSDEAGSSSSDFTPPFFDNTNAYDEPSYPSDSDSSNNSGTPSTNISSPRTFSSSEEKISFTVNALLTGKNYKALYEMKPSDYSIEEITQVMNRFRAAFGLSPVVYNPEISKIAQKHADYLAANAEGILILDTSRPNYQPEDFHNEARSHTGFTGVTPTDRAIAGGYTKYPFLEGVGYELLQTFPAHMFGTLYAPLHRQALLTASMKEFGFADKETLGNSQSGSFKNDARIFTVINYAYDNSQPGEKDLVFPPSGTTLYDYTRPLYEIPYPFDLGGNDKHHAFSFTINNQSGGLDRSSIKFYDVTADAFLPVSLDKYWAGTSVAHLALKNPLTMLPNHSYKLIYKDLNGNEKIAEYKTGSESF